MSCGCGPAPTDISVCAQQKSEVRPAEFSEFWAFQHRQIYAVAFQKCVYTLQSCIYIYIKCRHDMFYLSTAVAVIYTAQSNQPEPMVQALMMHSVYATVRAVAVSCAVQNLWSLGCNDKLMLVLPIDIGSIIGATVFFIFAIILIAWLMVRIRRQRAAALAQPQYYPDPNMGGAPPQQYYGSGQPQGAAPYPAPSAYGPGGPTQQQQAYQTGSPSPAPTNFANDAQREQWEREQYEKYGEAGLVQGQPVTNVGNGVQMTPYK